MFSHFSLMLDLIILYRFTPFLLSVNLDKIISSSTNALLSESQICMIDCIVFLLNNGLFLCMILLLQNVFSLIIDLKSLVCTDF